MVGAGSIDTGANGCYTDGVLQNGQCPREKIGMEQIRFVCPKCGCGRYESDQFQATGGNFAKIFDIQNKKFITVSCAQCGYTELYRAQSSDGWNILDFLLGN